LGEYGFRLNELGLTQCSFSGPGGVDLGSIANDLMTAYYHQRAPAIQPMLGTAGVFGKGKFFGIAVTCRRKLLKILANLSL
jgi:hypothetical protein